MAGAVGGSVGAAVVVGGPGGPLAGRHGAQSVGEEAGRTRERERDGLRAARRQGMDGRGANDGVGVASRGRRRAGRWRGAKERMPRRRDGKRGKERDANTQHVGLGDGGRRRLAASWRTGHAAARPGTAPRPPRACTGYGLGLPFCPEAKQQRPVFLGGARYRVHGALLVRPVRGAYSVPSPTGHGGWAGPAAPSLRPSSTLYGAPTAYSFAAAV